MMRSILITLSGIYLLASNAFAQQDPLYTQYYFNPTYYNPAFASVRDMMSINAGYRYQGNGSGNGNGQASPQSYVFGITSTFPNSNKAGLGFNVSNDKIGVNNFLNINLALSYNLQLSDYMKLSFGLLGCMRNTSTDNGKLNYNPAVTAVDENFPKGYYSAWNPNVGFGLWLNSEDKYYIGISVPKMLKITSKDEGYVLNSTARHYYLTGGYIINADGDLPIRLSTMIRKVEGAPMSADIIGSVLLFHKIWAGAMVRNTPCIGIITQIDVNDHLQIAGSFEHNLNKYTAIKDCFELQLRYNLSAFKLQTVVKPIF